MNQVTQFSGDSANLVLYWILRQYHGRFDKIIWIDTLGIFNPTALPLTSLEKTAIIRAFDAEGLRDAIHELESDLMKNGDFSYALFIDSFSNPLGLLMAKANISYAHASMMSLGRQLRMLTRKFKIAVYLSTSLVYVKQLRINKPALGSSWPFCLDHSFILQEDLKHNKGHLICNQSRTSLLGTTQLLLWVRGSFVHESLTINFYRCIPYLQV
ncbi:RAD51D-like protein 1 [Schizosaccharomyces osmophilus]|uniref:RAD51D-like protein 1 n=1 Tax=Schizosaccharomyces osmophilus TaxID=2545709 RepID=A0AAF0AW53_9SCHI|nr:RAD51D-like protein 1 [Schizosaccharomyces osmophilus]WBW73187.1 RAD51D-like protein 1 [Schizosaccharomyces osmophilus]